MMSVEHTDWLISAFANRLAAGEIMEAPKDLQFYANNSRALEAALRQIQIVDDANNVDRGKPSG